MRILLVLIAVAALAAGAWLFRDLIPGLGKSEPEVTAVSPEAAEQAEKKLERLRSSGDTIHLNEVEFTSYLRYRAPLQIAEQLESAAVDFEGEKVTFSGRLPADRLPDTRQVRAIRNFIPDTADVSVNGGLRTLSPGRAALRVDGVSFAKVPVPADVYADALKSLGRRDEPGLGPNEYAFPLPPGVGSARVEAGQLVLSPAGQ
jgi:hypothetical protein